MGSNYIAIWPYVTPMGNQVLDDGRPGFLNLLGANSPQEMGLTGITVAKFYETLAKYGVLVTRKEPSEYTGSELRQAKAKIEKAIKGTSGYGTPAGTDKLVLELALKLIKDLQKERSKAGLSGFWDTLVNISGAGQTDTQVPPPPTTTPPANDDDDKPKSKLPLILGITAGVAVLGITVALIIKNRNKK